MEGALGEVDCALGAIPVSSGPDRASTDLAAAGGLCQLSTDAFTGADHPPEQGVSLSSSQSPVSPRSALLEGFDVPEHFGQSHYAYTAQCWVGCPAAPREEGQGVRRWQGDIFSEPRIHTAWESPMPLPKALRNTWPKET